jgi:uncharacterized protein involved in exopolysaccharide biosynthesis
MLEAEIARRGPNGPSTAAAGSRNPPASHAENDRAASAAADPVASAPVRLEDRLLESRMRLAGLEETRRRLEGNANPSASRPLKELYSKEATLDRMEDDIDLLRRMYTDIAERASQTKVDLAVAQPPMRLLEPATTPDQPVPTGRTRTIGVGVLAGLILSACFVLAGDLRRHARK